MVFSTSTSLWLKSLVKVQVWKDFTGVVFPDCRGASGSNAVKFNCKVRSEKKTCVGGLISWASFSWFLQTAPPTTCITTSRATTRGSPATPPVPASPPRTSVRSSASAAPSVRARTTPNSFCRIRPSLMWCLHVLLCGCRPEPFPRLSVQSPV